MLPVGLLAPTNQRSSIPGILMNPECYSKTMTPRPAISLDYRMSAWRWRCTSLMQPSSHAAVPGQSSPSGNNDKSNRIQFQFHHLFAPGPSSHPMRHTLKPQESTTSDPSSSTIEGLPIHHTLTFLEPQSVYGAGPLSGWIKNASMPPQSPRQ